MAKTVATACPDLRVYLARQEPLDNLVRKAHLAILVSSSLDHAHLPDLRDNPAVLECPASPDAPALPARMEPLGKHVSQHV